MFIGACKRKRVFSGLVESTYLLAVGPLPAWLAEAPFDPFCCHAEVQCITDLMTTRNIAGALPSASLMWHIPNVPQGRTPVACNTTFWVAAGLSWIVWMFAVSAATAESWFCIDDIGCAGIDALEDFCEDNPDFAACDPRERTCFAPPDSPAVVQ